MSQENYRKKDCAKRLQKRLKMSVDNYIGE